MVVALWQEPNIVIFVVHFGKDYDYDSHDRFVPQ
jgi:hypothetical protein